MGSNVFYTSQELNNTYYLDRNGILKGGIGSKEITLTYTGSGNESIIKVHDNFGLGEYLKTATIENLIIDGSNATNVTGILLEDVLNSQIRNVTIKNCSVGIKLTATTDVEQLWCESNRIEHVRMENVDKGIVFDRGNGKGSFGFTTIDDVGIALKDNASSVGIEIIADYYDSTRLCKPYNSLIRANVWMGPNNPGTGMVIDADASNNSYGEIRQSLWKLAVYNTGGTPGGIGIDLRDGNGNGDGKIVFDNQAFLLTYHNLSDSAVGDGPNNEMSLIPY